MEFFIAKNTVFAKTVDVDRLARKLVAEGLRPTKGAALNLAARLLGVSDHHTLLAQAKAPNLATWTTPEILDFLSLKAIAEGSRFPKDLPLKFDGAWQRSAAALLTNAIAARTHGTLEFIALVGGPGSGKTLLASHLCKLMGGRVVDVGLYRWFMHPHQPAAGEILVFDRPALHGEVLSRRGPSTPFEGMWRQATVKQRTVEFAQEAFRLHWTGIPMDEPDAFADGSIARELARNTPLIISFGSMGEVQQALDSSTKVITNGSMATLNWSTAHVVNLDELSAHTLRGPGYQEPADSN